MAAGRQAFVDGLVASNRITAARKDELLKVVAADVMSAEQFAAFKAVYEDMPTLPLLANHGGGPANPAGDAGKPMGDVLDLYVERRGVE